MTTTTAIPAGSTRTITDFATARSENTQTRFWVGVHFPLACNNGLAMGHPPLTQHAREAGMFARCPATRHPERESM
jgi:hypothetical protein